MVRVEKSVSKSKNCIIQLELNSANVGSHIVIYVYKLPFLVLYIVYWICPSYFRVIPLGMIFPTDLANPIAPTAKEI